MRQEGFEGRERRDVIGQQGREVVLFERPGHALSPGTVTAAAGSVREHDYAHSAGRDHEVAWKSDRASDHIHLPVGEEALHIGRVILTILIHQMRAGNMA